MAIIKKVVARDSKDIKDSLAEQGFDLSNYEYKALILEEDDALLNAPVDAFEEALLEAVEKIRDAVDPHLTPQRLAHIVNETVHQVRNIVFSMSVQNAVQRTDYVYPTAEGQGYDLPVADSPAEADDNIYLEL